MRRFTPVVRSYVRAATASIEQVIGDATNIGTELGDPDLILKRLGEFIGGKAEMRFQEGRPILTSGHNYFQLSRDGFIGGFDNLDQEIRHDLIELALLVDTDAPWYQALDAAKKPTGPKTVTDLRLKAAMDAFFSEGASSGISSVADGLFNAIGIQAQKNPQKKAKLIEMVLYYYGKTSRKDPSTGVTSKITGSSEEISERFLREFSDEFDDAATGNFRARHSAVIIATQGAAAQSRNLLTHTGVIVNRALGEAY